MDMIDLVLLVLAVIGLTILMRSTFRRVTRVAGAPGATVRSEFAELEDRRRAQHDVEEVMLELDLLARQIHGQLDTRFAKLEAAIRDADSRIERLTDLLRKTHGTESMDVTIQDGEEGPARPRIEASPRDWRHAEIYRLADSGIHAAEIARETGKTIGEIDLILALRRAQGVSPADVASPAAPPS